MVSMSCVLPTNIFDSHEMLMALRYALVHYPQGSCFSRISCIFPTLSLISIVSSLTFAIARSNSVDDFEIKSVIAILFCLTASVINHDLSPNLLLFYQTALCFAFRVHLKNQEFV